MFGHVGKPEYKEEELKSMEFPDDNESNSDGEENDVNSSKQENRNWFKSLHCTVMPTSFEWMCCEDLKDLDLLQVAFETLIMNKLLLQ